MDLHQYFSKNLQEERSKLIEEMSTKQSGEFREKLDSYLKQIEEANELAKKSEFSHVAELYKDVFYG